MAHLPLHRVQISLFLFLLALSTTASARPCRTFLISSYTFSLPSSDDPSQSSTATLTTFTEIRSFLPLPIFSPEIFLDRSSRPLRTEEFAAEIDRRPPQIRPDPAPFGFSADDFSSLRDRTKDILSVVVALLFGVGCGALTAATMYLFWSMFSSRYDYYRYDDYLNSDVDDEEEKIKSPNKLGYVKIPATEAAPAPAKEAV